MDTSDAWSSVIQRHWGARISDSKSGDLVRRNTNLGGIVIQTGAHGEEFGSRPLKRAYEEGKIDE